MRKFNARNSDWDIYKRRLDNYFVVNAIQEDGKKRAILLNFLDEEAYKLMYNLCLPRIPEDKTYKELTGLFDKHFKIAESPFLARAKFFTAQKFRHESANEWAAILRGLAANCEFEFREELIDRILRDRFVIGFDKGQIQAKLFKEKKKIKCRFVDVIEVAVAEMAASSETSGGNKVVVKKPAVHHVTSTSTYVTSRSQSQASTSSAQKSREKCACCGRNNHPTKKCRFRDYACNLCKIKGHLAPVCPKKEQKIGNSSKHKNAYISA